MVKEARLVAAVPFPPELQRAALVTVGGIGLGALVLFTQLPSILPDYPALVVAFLFWVVAPGWLIQQALFGDRSTSPVERTIVAFLMSMALAALPGLVALRLHWSLEAFAMAYVALASVAAGLSLLWHRDAELEAEPESEPEAGFRHGRAPLALLIGAAALAVLTAPFWASDRISAGADDWVYLSYVQEYLTADGLDAAEPPGGSGAFDRMGFNVWVVMEALLADSSGAEAADVLQEYLPPLLLLLALAATFALARGLFRNTTIALLAVVLLLGYALIDVSAHEGIGHNLLVRISEDKMVATYVLLPVALLLSAKFLVEPRLRAFVAGPLAVLALFVVHPMGLAFLGIAIVGLALLRALVLRSGEPLAAGVVLSAPMLILAMLALSLPSSESTATAAVFDPRLLFREDVRIVALNDDFSMGNFHLILHPLLLAALALAPLLWWRSQRDVGAQLLFAMMWGALLVFFVPPFATLYATAISWNAVWRLAWMLMMPVALVLAVAIHAGLVRLQASSWSFRPATLVALPAIAAGVLLGGAFIVQESYQPLDGGAFYDRTDASAVLPWTDHSLTVSGLERVFSDEWRLPDQARGLVRHMESSVPVGSTVLVPDELTTFLPGRLAGISIVDPLGNGSAEEKALLRSVYGVPLTRPEIDQALREAGVDYLVVRSRTPTEDALRHVAGYTYADFAATSGAPEPVETSLGSGEYWAWSFGPGERARVGGPRADIPADIDPHDPALEFALLLTPSSDVSGDEGARLVVHYLKASEGTVINGIFDVELPDGTPAGASILERRSPQTPVEGGARYAFSVTRLGDSPVDTYEDDVWLAGLTVRYWPERLVRLDDGPYRIYEVAE